MLTTLLAFLFTLGVLVVIHELGHYWVGRWCGVRVLRFSVGFGKVLARRTDRHGTEWALSAIPLGGYVKFLDGREDSLPPEQAHQAFDKQSVWRRIAIVSAGPLANLLLASVLYALLFSMGVREPAPNQGPPLPVIQAVMPDSAAAAAGLQAGDVILQAGGVLHPDPQAFVDLVGAAAGEPVPLLVQRGGDPAGQQSQTDATLRAGQTNPSGLTAGQTPDEVSLVVVPQFDPEAGVGRIGVRLGVNLQFVEVHYGPLESLWRGVERTADIAATTVTMLGRMLIGQAPWSQISGPVTIADYAGQTARMGLEAYIAFLAVVSVSLGVLNLLPIPMLDGGHLLYYLVEIVRGSPPPERWFEVGQRVGLSLLLALMGVALFNDFVRLLG